MEQYRALETHPEFPNIKSTSISLEELEAASRLYLAETPGDMRYVRLDHWPMPNVTDTIGWMRSFW